MRNVVSNQETWNTKAKKPSKIEHTVSFRRAEQAEKQGTGGPQAKTLSNH